MRQNKIYDLMQEKKKYLKNLQWILLNFWFDENRIAISSSWNSTAYRISYNRGSTSMNKYVLRICNYLILRFQTLEVEFEYI